MNNTTINTRKQALYINNIFWRDRSRIKLLELCNYNPTIGAITEHQYLRRSHKNFIPESPQIKYLKGIVKERIAQLYPKTKKIRKYIVKDNRLALDFVTRSRGYNWIDKLKIFLKR